MTLSTKCALIFLVWEGIILSTLRSKIYDSYADFYFKICKAALEDIHAEKISLPKDFTVTYHTGAIHTKPNSIKSIEAAIDHGAKIVEIDVSFRPDGSPVIIHDSAPRSNQGIFLENALEAVAKSDTCMINLDLKSLANTGAVDELVKMYGLTERVFYTGVFADWVDTVKANSAIPYYLNHTVTESEAEDKSAAQAAADKAKALGAVGINANFAPVTELFVETMRENGLLVSLWTVNNMADMLSVLKLKPDNITTKNPHILKRLLIEYWEKFFGGQI